MIISFLRKNFNLIATIGGMVFLFVFFMHSTASKVWYLDGSLNNDIYGDLFSSIHAAKDTMSSINPYHLIDPNTLEGREWRASYAYPLTQAWMIIPLTFLSPGKIKLVWSLLMALCLGASCWLILRMISQTAYYNTKGWGIALSSLIILMCFEPVQNNYIYMQVNIFMLFGIVLFLYMYINNKKNYGAIALAFAISLKMLPILFILFLLIRKDWYTLLLTGIWCFFFCFFPVIWMGGEIFNVYHFFIKEVIAPRMGIVYSNKLFFTLSRTVSWIMPELLHNKVMTTMCNLLTLLLICLLDLFGRKKNNSDFFSGCLYMLGILLLMPQSQIHYLILIIPGWFICVLGCLRYGQMKYWIILGMSYALIWPMLWIEDTPAHFLSLSLTLYLTTLFLFSEKDKNLV